MSGQTQLLPLASNVTENEQLMETKHTGEPHSGDICFSK